MTSGQQRTRSTTWLLCTSTRHTLAISCQAIRRDMSRRSKMPRWSMESTTVAGSHRRASRSISAATLSNPIRKNHLPVGTERANPAAIGTTRLARINAARRSFARLQPNEIECVADTCCALRAAADEPLTLCVMSPNPHEAPMDNHGARPLPHQISARRYPTAPLRTVSNPFVKSQDSLNCRFIPSPLRHQPVANCAVCPVVRGKRQSEIVQPRRGRSLASTAGTPRE